MFKSYMKTLGSAQSSVAFQGKCETHTLPKAMEGEKVPPAEEGLLKDGLYPETQLGENLGLVLEGLAGLKLRTFCPCRGEDWTDTGASFVSCF